MFSLFFSYYYTYSQGNVQLDVGKGQKPEINTGVRYNLDKPDTKVDGGISYDHRSQRVTTDIGVAHHPTNNSTVSV